MLFARIAAVLGVTLMAAIAASPAQAVTMTQCSALYQAAQTAGALNGLKWNDFRKANCSTTSAAPAAAAAVVAPATAVPKASTSAKAATPKVPAAVNSAAAEPNLANTDNMAEPAATRAIAPRGVIFPRAVEAQFSSESAGKARMHTCLDQYRQDKAANGLGSMTWIQAGGGYYSICNTKLKG